MDGGTISGAAVSSVFTATLRISQIAYELKAVGEQTRDLLDSTNHVEMTMQAVRTLRRQKSMHLEKTEKIWIDNVLANTEKTLNNVAMLIEPARVDMQTKFGSIGLLRRGMFVFRDSPKVATNLSRLGLASQSLNTVMNILCTREGYVPPTPVEKGPVPAVESTIRPLNETVRQPPTYDESEFLNRRRSHIKKPSVLPEAPVTRMEVVEEPAPKTSAILYDSGLIPISPVVHVTEVAPTPNAYSREDPFEGSDGLQFYDSSIGSPDSGSSLGGWNSIRRASSNAQLPSDEVHNQQWQNRLQQPDNRTSQYQCWHGDTTSRQSYASLQSFNSQSSSRLSTEFAMTIDTRTSASAAAGMPTLFHSSSSYDLRSAGSSLAGSEVQQNPKPLGRSQRRAWLEFQSER
jgi:hypothetical protein